MADIFSMAPWGVLLLVFLGMAVLQWRALTSLHELAKFLAQLLGQQPTVKVPVLPTPPAPVATPPKPAPVAAPAPLPSVVVDQGLVDFVKKAEAFSPKAFWDYKQYSIGYGTKANSATEVIDEAEAEKRLAVEIGKAAQSVEAFAPNAPLGVKQALTDLTYNAGPGWQQAGLGDLIKAGTYEDAKSHLLAYNHANGQVLAGLTTRREAEVSWFDHPL